jgi:hypothetical protein
MRNPLAAGFLRKIIKENKGGPVSFLQTISNSNPRDSLISFYNASDFKAISRQNIESRMDDRN